MDDLFTLFDSFFDEVITNVNDVPLNNFIFNQNQSNQNLSSTSGNYLTSINSGNSGNSGNWNYRMLSTSFEHTPFHHYNNESDNIDEENDNIDEENINYQPNDYYLHSQQTENTTSGFQSLDNLDHYTNSVDSIIQNANRLRVLHELYNQTISSQPVSQNLSYNYNIESRITNIPNTLTSTTLTSTLDIFNPPSVEIPSQITDLLTLFFNDQLLGTLDTLEDVKVTLDKSIFDKLPEIIFNDQIKIEEPCNICMEEYTLNDVLKQLPCNHYYHKDCISKWLCNEKTTCPMCRKDVRSAFETETNS